MSLTATLKFIFNHPLNRHGRRQAVERYLKWQIGSRLFPGPVIFDWVAGAKIIVRPGEIGVTQNLYCGLQDFSDMAYLLHLLTPGDLFVDVGANVGAYTLLACAGKGARGYSFEPVPSTFARLTDNLLINHLSDRVIAVNAGISDKEGELSFTVGYGPANHVAGADDKREDCVIVPVQSLARALAGESPTFLKIDVEGFETPVINGASTILGNPTLNSILVELNGSGLRYGFDEQAIVRKLYDFGFSSYLYDPFRRQLTQLNGTNKTGDNTLFVRNITAVQERLQRALPVSVHSKEF